MDGSNNLWQYASGTWSEMISDGTVQGVAANDPNNSSHVMAVNYNGNLNESLNAGGTWSGWSDNSAADHPTYSATNDIGWITNLGTLGGSSLTFNQSVSDALIEVGLNDIWDNTLSGGITTSTLTTWNSRGRGTEQLVAVWIVVPPGGVPVASTWDRPWYYLSSTTSYPTSFGPVADADICAGWSLDYASSESSFLVGLGDGQYAGGPQRCGFSTSGGEPGTWTLYTDFPIRGTGGSIAASTPENIVFSFVGNAPYYTTNGNTAGARWTEISFPGVSNWSSFGGSSYAGDHYIAADRVTANTFYAVFGGTGFFTSSNSGATWTLASNSSNVTQTNSINTVPGQAGHIFAWEGYAGGADEQPASTTCSYSENGGSTWTVITTAVEAYCIGFGAPAPGQSYPVVYMVGWVNNGSGNEYGVWQSVNGPSATMTWTAVGEETWPFNSLDFATCITGDPDKYGNVYVGFIGSGYVIYQG